VEKKKRQAAALNYSREKQGLPTLVAKGEGDAAEQILKVARANGVPIHEDPMLVDALSRLNLNDEIPAQLFAVVASVIGFIYRLQAEQEARSYRF
jgi:flagellar biosynthesis protein